MKKIKTILSVALCAMALFPFGEAGRGFSQNVGINATGATPDSSALLDLNSTNKGFLITRVDTVNISSPAFGLMTLAPSDSCLYMFNGTTWVGMGGGGTNCSCNYSNSGSTTPVFPCGGTVIPIVEVTGLAGKVWMDRNLGASQVATSSTDALAYGDLYQWGRCSDGHEKRNSSRTAILSKSDTPGHGNFITSSGSPYDWRSPQNDNLWQGITGINNPCPTGYRIPTKAELDAERGSWGTQDAAGAFSSPLKLSVGGYDGSNGTLGNDIGSFGFYWSSTVFITGAWELVFSSISANMGATARADGLSVRCIKD